MGKYQTFYFALVIRFEVRKDKTREPTETFACRRLDWPELAHVVVCPVSTTIPASDVGILAYETLDQESVAPQLCNSAGGGPVSGLSFCSAPEA